MLRKPRAESEVMRMTVIHNPAIWADVPDNDVIRVGDTFYMVSTSMHSTPGCPIMRSYDLKNWTVVSYVFDRLSEKEGNNLENGQNIYGQGSWAASLRRIGERYYCLFNSNDDGHAYIFTTRDIESSGWEKHSLWYALHDPSMFTDDDGRTYVLYGNGDIHLTRLTADCLAIDEEFEDRILFSTEKENIGLRAEGCHAYKINGRYYALFIEWPKDGHGRRREVCYRADSLGGPFEHRIILDDDMGYHNAGVAQGAIFTLPDDETWAAVMFQDHGAVGRIPYVLPVTWEDGWPMLGIDGKVPEYVELPFEPAVDSVAGQASGNIILAEDVGGDGFTLSASDNFRRMPGEERSLADAGHLWQWNHNPDDTMWSLTERPGYLRLVNGHICEYGVLQARNTLTQRTCGPRCSARTHVELEGMKPGDSAGIAAIQGQFGIVGVRCVDDGTKTVVMCVNDGSYGEKELCVLTPGQEGKPLTDIYLRIDFDFEDNRDTAVFYASYDGSEWFAAGEELNLKYTLDHFMGCRIGLYSYCTEQTGGYVDFEYFDFRYGDEL